MLKPTPSNRDKRAVALALAPTELAESPVLQAGELIDIWVVEKALGAGGMGSVYRCHNRSATRILAAIKVLEGDFGRRNADIQARFVREAEILYGLKHPNIVQVRNIRVDHAPPYIEMEFVAGESIEDKLQRGALPLSEALRLWREIASAVAYLHDRGIRHRDLKPANVLVEHSGMARLVDFGLAVETQGDRLTQGNMTFGTVSYAPPEWIHPEHLDPRLWDLYAVGVMAYEMLTGEVAFPMPSGGSARQAAMQVVVAKQDHPPLDPGPAFEEEIRQLVRDLTHPNPERRLGEAAALVERLRVVRQTAPREAGATLAPDSCPPAERPQASTWVDEARVTLMPEVPRGVTLMPAPPAETAPTAPASSRVRWVGVAVGVLAFGGLLALVAGAVGYALWPSAPAGPQSLRVAVQGISADSAVALSLGGAGGARDGNTWTFAVTSGTAEVRWALGARCEAEPCQRGDCPSWCAHGALSVPIAEGVLLSEATLDLAPHVPSPRAVTVQASAPLAGLSWPGAEVKLQDNQAVLSSIPGEYVVRAWTGACPAEGCQGPCPEGCQELEGALEVPRGTSPLALSLPPFPTATPLEAIPEAPVTPDHAPTRENPVKPHTPQETPVIPPTPVEAPEAQSQSSGKPVTAGQFARWLEAHPDWARDAAIAAGRADENYLSNWSNGQPQSGGAAMTAVSWYAAAAYCKGRGGLADLDAPPLTWSESEGLAIEYRSAGGQSAFRTGDGAVHKGVPGKDANLWTGFRCAR